MNVTSAAGLTGLQHQGLRDLLAGVAVHGGDGVRGGRQQQLVDLAVGERGPCLVEARRRRGRRRAARRAPAPTFSVSSRASASRITASVRSSTSRSPAEMSSRITSTTFSARCFGS